MQKSDGKGVRNQNFCRRYMHIAPKRVKSLQIETSKKKPEGRSRTLYVHTEVFLCFKRILKTLSAIEAKLDLK